ALPYAMPAVFSLALLGGAFALARWPRAREPLAIVGFATVPMAAALFMAVAVSQRYTADFCPALLVAAAFGLTALELLQPRWRRTARALAATLALLSVAITL